MEIDRAYIASKAYKELLSWGIPNFPVKPLNIRIKNIVISSFQRYARIVRADVGQISVDGFFEDGYVIKNVRGTNLILYDASAFGPRTLFTIMHEIGHVRLGHTHHGDLEEFEANYYAAETMSPTPVLAQIKTRGYTISGRMLKNCFGLSKDAGRRKIADMENCVPLTPYNDHLLKVYSRYINMNFPQKVNRQVCIDIAVE